MDIGFEFQKFVIDCDRPISQILGGSVEKRFAEERQREAEETQRKRREKAEKKQAKRKAEEKRKKAEKTEKTEKVDLVDWSRKKL
jgi:hypothetical protein